MIMDQQAQQLSDRSLQQPPLSPNLKPGPAGATRPGAVTTAGILLIILGAFAGLVGLILIALAWSAMGDMGDIGMPGELGDVMDAVATMIMVFGSIIGSAMIVYAVFKIIAGVKVLRLRNTWRITGIVLCAIAMLAWMYCWVYLLQSGDSEETTGLDFGTIVFILIPLIAESVTLVLLARSGGVFRR
jgi:hypothetical protein